MSESLSREQLLDYIKKQKLKIKKLEGKNAELIAQADVVSLATTSTVAVTSDANSDELDECLEKIGILEDSLEAKNKELRDFQNSTKNKIKVLENDVSSKNSEILLLQEKLSEDADALAEAIRRLVTNRSELERLGRMGKEKFSRQFEINHAVEGLINVYQLTLKPNEQTVS